MQLQRALPVTGVAYSKELQEIVSVVIEMIMIRHAARITVQQDFLRDAMIVIVFKIQAGIKLDLIIDSQSHQGNMQAIHVLLAIQIREISAYLHAQPAMFAERWMMNMTIRLAIATNRMHVLHAIPTAKKTTDFYSTPFQSGIFLSWR
jgi:hypothetical protein